MIRGDNYGIIAELAFFLQLCSTGTSTRLEPLRARFEAREAKGYSGGALPVAPC